MNVPAPNWSILFKDDVWRNIILRSLGENWFYNNHLSTMVRESFPTILEKLQAMLITPVMEYPLQITKTPDSDLLKQNEESIIEGWVLPGEII